MVRVGMGLWLAFYIQGTFLSSHLSYCLYALCVLKGMKGFEHSLTVALYSLTLSVPIRSVPAELYCLSMGLI
ncbi:hypothetical protein BDW69DRAFT_117952 [Aspergillus filifer]